MTARAGSRAGAFDPSEWAARRKSAVEKAARLREERKRGHLDDTCTFAPQTNTDSNSGSRSSSRQDDNDIDGSYTSEPSQQRSYGRTGSDASGQDGYSDVDDSSNHEFVSRRGPIAPQGNARQRGNHYDGDEGPELQDVYRPPRRSMADPSERDLRMQSNPMRGQASEPPEKEIRMHGNPMRAQERGPVGRGGRLGGQAPRDYGQQPREARDLQDGYRDKAFNQPIGIKFAGRGGPMGRGHAGPPAADSGPTILDNPEDRDAHDTFTALLRGEEAPPGGPRGGRRASGGRKPDWNSDLYTPTVMEDEPPPLPARPNRRGSRNSMEPPAPRRQVAPPPPEEEDDRSRERERRESDRDTLPVNKAKQGRPDWIDSWEEQAEAGGGRRAEPRREEPRRQEPRREEQRAQDMSLPRQRAIQRPRDEEEEEEADEDHVLSASARPKLSLLKAKLRNGKAGRRSQSAPTSVEDNPVVQDSPRHPIHRGQPLSSGLGGGLREDEHLPPANQRFRRDQATRAQTTPVVLGGGLHDDDDDEEEVVREERKPRSGIRPPMGRPLAPPKPLASPRTNRLAKASAMGQKARAGSFSQREEEDDEDRPIAIKVRQEEKKAGGWTQGKGRVSNEYEDEGEDAPIQHGRGGGPSAFDGGMPEEDDATLIPCQSCGRKFVERAFRVHQKVCKKVFQSKRKAFDSRKARVEGTEAAKYVKGLPNPVLAKPGGAKAGPSSAAAAKPGMRRASSGTSQMSSDSAPWEAPPAPKKALPRPMAKRGAHDETPIKAAGSGKAKWRAQSDAFRQMLKQNRMIKEAEDSGKPIPTFAAARSEPDPSLIQCPHCNRRFNEQAAERHIPKCQSIVAKPKPLSKGTGIQLGAAARQLARQSSGSSLGGGGGGMGRRPLAGRR